MSVSVAEDPRAAGEDITGDLRQRWRRVGPVGQLLAQAMAYDARDGWAPDAGIAVAEGASGQQHAPAVEVGQW